MEKSLSRRTFVVGSALAGVAGLSASAALAAPASSQASDGAAEGEDWLGAEPQISDADVELEESCDVVVVGLGNAGVVAYRSAAEAGADVIAVEKSATDNATGGQFALIGGPYEERWGRADLDKEQIINEHMLESSYMCKRAIMSRYAYEVADMFDWLVKPMADDMWVGDSNMSDIPDGVTNYLLPDNHPLPEGYDWQAEVIPTFPTTVNFGSMAEQHAAQIKAAEDTGHAKAYYGHFAEKLERDESGRVSAVYVRNAETGKYKKITAAKGVILTTGDYSSDPAMVAHFIPETIENGVTPMWIHQDVEGNMTNTGDGHKMGAWIGADIQQHHATNDHHMGGGADISGQGVMGINGYLNLNLLGQRFMNEDVPGCQIQAQIELQPGKRTYQFFDSAWPEQVGAFPYEHGCVNYCLTEDEMPKNNSGASFYCRTPKSVDAAVESGVAFKGDTLEELLDQLPDIDKDAALASIERYNEVCAAGVDTDFGKDSRRLFALENPPYYACAFVPAIMLVAMGGLKSDEECHVYDTEGKVIEGLYVAGNVQGDRFAVSYPISLKGLSIGMAQFYGYVAGQNAAAMA